MTEEQLRKYQQLKEKTNSRIKESVQNSNILFKECVESLDGCMILSSEETLAIFREFEEHFPIRSEGRISWNDFKGIVNKDGLALASKTFELSDEYYILWDNADIPCVICKLEMALEHIDEVVSVAFDTWLLSKDISQVIEFHHEGEIICGKLV